MNSFYIYRFIYDKTTNNSAIKHKCSATVIFCHNEKIDESLLKSEIKIFYEKHHHTDEIYVIGGEYLKGDLLEVFDKRQGETFMYLPKVKRDYLKDNIVILSFNNKGNLKILNNAASLSAAIEQRILNEGMSQIFIKRGGLIESKHSHHFVFPSGKHCNKFLRTGNILLHSSEIYFIAFNMLRFYDEDNHRQIYCDTSSINTLAFALQELKRRLVPHYKLKTIESFSSYNGLYEKRGNAFSNALILISASTSANILQRIIKSNALVKKDNIVILFFLGSKNSYLENRERILCDISKSDENPNGIDFYDTYSISDCIYCKKGSYPVEVSGDVFLLEKPLINRIKISKDDASKGLSEFIEEFKSKKINKNNVLKVNYKENSKVDNKYEIYFDMFHVLKLISNKSKYYLSFKSKLFDYINQYIPSNTKYLIHLNDEGSKVLGELILGVIKENYLSGKMPELVSQDKMLDVLLNADGSVVVVASCISNGKNMLYISRALRTFEKLKRVYFVALTRTMNKAQLDFLKSNLKQGFYGGETNTFVSVYNQYCNNSSKNTSWIHEIDFLKELKDFVDPDEELNDDLLQIINNRIGFLENSLSDNVKGLANGIFLPNSINGLELRLRKSFAFFNFIDYENDISQADVYFSISSIINSLRNSDKLEKCLAQTEYVRNVIDPGNFNRYNDGIIQSAILRAANKDELAYEMDHDLSRDMKDIIETIIKYQASEQGEALLEFLYAIAIGKLSMKENHIQQVCNLVNKNISNSFAKLLVKYIESEIINLPKSLTIENKNLREENKLLRSKLLNITS